MNIPAKRAPTDQISKFLDIYTEVMGFADEPTHADPQIMAEWEKHIRHEFLTEIYVSRTEEEKSIIEHVTSDFRALSIEGVGGSGKSTLIRHVLSSIDSQDYPRVILDMHKSYPYEFKSEYTVAGYVKSIDDMVTQQVDSLFCTKHPERTQAVYEHLFFGKIPEQRLSLFGVREDLAIYAASEGVKQENLHIWYLQQRDNCNAKIKRFEKRAKRASRVSDWLIALKPFLGFKMFLLVLDNVDRIERDRQKVCFQFAIDSLNDGWGLVKPIITIRQENAHGVWQEAWATTVVRCSIDGRSVDKIPVFGEMKDLLIPVIWKRHSWCERWLEDYRAECLIVKKIAQLLQDSNGWGKICELANGSIRLGAEYYYRFIHYILSEIEADALEVLLKSPVRESLMKSCLFAWIARAGDILDKQALNLCKIYLKCQEQKFASFGCDLNYMILANLERRDGVTEIGQVTYDFSLLKVDPEEVIQRLWDLYSMKREDYGHVVELWDGDKQLERNGIGVTTQVAITPRGRCLLRDASVTFTFINTLLEQHGKLKREEWRNRGAAYYAIENYGIHARNNVRFIADVAFLHAIELCRIAITINKRDWYDRYTSRFCIQDDLQVTRILAANKAFINELRTKAEEDLKNDLDVCSYACVQLGRAYSADVARILPRHKEIYNYPGMVEHLLSQRTRQDLDLSKWNINVAEYLPNT